MSITLITDMLYTRSGEATESNVLSAHDPLIWEFSDNAIAANPTATIQFVAKDHDMAVVYTSDVFPCYLLVYLGTTAAFRFDATQIIKHIIDNYFYKEISEIIEPENYGSFIEVTIKTYDDAVLEDTEVIDYFASQAVNQIGDEYGSNIPRLFYNDTEEIAHFLGYPTKIFFYMATDQSAHSPLIEIIDRDITESANLISGWTKLLYDTFDTTDTAVDEAIELGANGTARSDAFTIELGKNYLILVPALARVGGQLPTFQFTNLGGDVIYSTELRAVVGDNAFILKCTTFSAVPIHLFVRNTAAAEWSCGPVQVIPVEDASDYGSLKLGVHCVDLGLLVLSSKSKYARVYYDHDAPVKIKDYNLHIFESCENAVYIRWLTKDGYYMYWAFSPYPKTVKSGDKIGDVINSFSEMALAQSRNFPVGYRNSFNRMDVIASAVPIAFRHKLMDLFTSPAVYLWRGQETPNENLISAWLNKDYETLETDGTVITSAINTAASGIAESVLPYFEVSQGESIVIIFNLALNSGTAPSVRVVDGSTNDTISNVVVSTAGFNVIELITTSSPPTAKIQVYNIAASNYSTSAIIVKRKEVELDWILLDKIEGSHTLREKMKHDNFECTLVLPENYTQQLSGQNL